MEDFNEYFGTTLSDEGDTIGGLMLHEFGHVPERGESIVYAGMAFEVLNADSRVPNTESRYCGAEVANADD